MLNADDQETILSLRALKQAALSSKPIVLWIGAGASKWAGYPSWKDLALELRSQPPMASKRMRQEINIYVRSVGVDDLVFAILFSRIADRLLMHPDFEPEWLELGKVVSSLISDTCFQELKEATSREISSVADGPFGRPVQPFERLVFSPSWGGILMPNTIWDYRNTLLAYELWRLWDLVFREICDQHAAIDCEEHSNALR